MAVASCIVTAVVALAGPVQSGAGTTAAAAASVRADEQTYPVRPGDPGVVQDTSEAVELPLTTLGDVELDRARGRVVVSGMGGIVVTTPTGRPQRQVPGVPDAFRFTLVGDGDTLVTTRWEDPALTVVDLTTPRVTRRVPLGPDNCPTDVSTTSGLVLFAYSTCDHHGPGWIGAWDPRTGELTMDVVGPEYGPSPLARLDAVPRHPGRLIYAPGEQVRRVDLRRGDAVEATVSEPVRTNRGIYTDSVAFTPDGETMLLTEERNAPLDLRAYSTDTLEQTSVFEDYYGGYRARAVAVRDDGRVAMGEDFVYGEDLTFFPLSGPRPVWRADLGRLDPSPDLWVPHSAVVLDGLEFDGDHVVAVTDTNYDRFLALRRMYAGPPTSLDVRTTPSKVDHGGRVEVVADDGVPPGSGPVELWAVSGREGPRLVASHPADSGDAARFTTTARSNTVYEVRVRSSADDYTTRSGKASVRVAADLGVAPTTGRRAGERWIMRPGARPTVRATVREPAPRACTGWTVQRLRSTGWRTVAQHRCRPLDAASRSSLVLPGPVSRGVQLRVGVSFAGSSANAPVPRRWTRISFGR